MTDLAAALDKQGIRLRSLHEGDQKTLCPICSHTRKKKLDKCLSVKIDDAGGAAWNCWHCSWTGNVPSKPNGHHYVPKPKAYTKPKLPENPLKPEAMYSALERRAIPREIVNAMGIHQIVTYFPDAEAELEAYSFPYVRNGEPVNCKFRAVGKKMFAQVKGAERTLYNLDNLKHSKIGIFVEGEPDVLAVMTAGYANVTTIPDGAPKEVREDRNDKRYQAIENCAAEIEHIEKWILAGDMDGPGKAHMEEVARRLGKEKCFTVRWPSLNDSPCKDANDALIHHGAQVVKECLENAEPWPLENIQSFDVWRDKVIRLYEHGYPQGESVGWPILDPHYRVRTGEVSVVTGLPNAGKSEWVDAVMVNLAERIGWKFGLCSFENPPEEHAVKLLEKRLRLPFNEGPRTRIPRAGLDQGLDWIRDHFIQIRSDRDAPMSIDDILSAARACVLRYGIRGLTIDPYNEIEHRRPNNQSETEYVAQMLGKVRRFAQSAGCHVWFIAHPTKMKLDDKGQLPALGLYSISGSAHWANKADMGVIVERPDKNTDDVLIRVAKVRFQKACGRPGEVTLKYDRLTGRYSGGEQ